MGECRGPSFIPLYHFHPLTNIQTFICNFAREMTITHFWSQHLYLPDCYSMSQARLTTLSNYYLIDWWGHVDFRLFACWFDSRFCYSYFTWENGGLELASTIILVLQANRLTKCASHLLGGGFIATFVEFIEFISSFWVKWGLVCRNWKYSFGITYGQLFCCLGLIGPKLGPIDPKLVVRLQTPDLRFILIF